MTKDRPAQQETVDRARTPAEANPDAGPPLAGLRVLDLSTVVAGPFGSEILGSLGADVIRVEPPAAAASWPLGANADPGSEAAGFAWALQRNKRSVCLDLKAPDGRAAFLDLVRASDVVYDNFRPGVMRRLGLDAAALRAVNPRIVSCSITGFGSEGPWAEVGAYDVAVQALGGSMAITGTGRPGDLPCRFGVPVGDIGGALYAVIGVLAALARRDREGRGQAIDVSLLDVQLALNTYRVPQVFGGGQVHEEPAPRRGGAGSTPYGPFRCGDARWLVVGVASRHWPAFCNALERPAWIGDARFATLALRQRNQAELEALVEARLRERPVAHWHARLRAAGVPASPVFAIEEAFAQPQARFREMLVEIADAHGRVARVAASPVRFAGEPRWPQRAPVAPCADSVAVRRSVEREKRGEPPVEAAARRRPLRDPRVERAIDALAAVDGPLRGTLVLELCGDEPSGTFGTQILADLGATVLKLERPPTGDPEPTPSPGEGETVEASIAYFFGLNRNKRSVCLDLRSPEGRAAAQTLARVADVVYDNHRPGVMARLGLDATTLRALQPSLVCCSVSGFGQDGPDALQPAYDATIQAAGGAMSITGTGEQDAPPVRWGNPIGGIGGALYAVIGILAALRRRAGASLDIALLDAQLAMHAYRVAPAMAGVRYEPQPRRGGSGALPYGPFLAGDGRWFVLGITAQFWPRACAVLGHPEWTDDPRFASEALRRANEGALNALVAGAMRTADSDEWQRRFIAEGIPGAKVLNVAEAFGHPHVPLRNMLVSFDHPLGRRLKVAGNPIRFGDANATAFLAAPGLGADTEVVLRELLGMAGEEIARWRSARIAWWPAAGEVYARPSVV